MIGRLVVVGLGLIGGSFAKGLRESGLSREVVGFDLDARSRELAVELGVVDRCADTLAEAFVSKTATIAPARIEAMAQRVHQLPQDLPAIARALAAIHSLPVPAKAERAPLIDAVDPLAALRADLDLDGVEELIRFSKPPLEVALTFGDKALRLIAAERISMFTGVPTMLWDLLHSARLADADLSSLRNIASGGQALTARDPEMVRLLNAAATEEADHLNWTAERLKSLKSRPSLLSPLWYAGAFAIGFAAGKLGGDQVSLGFVVETERQVEAHLQSHMDLLPAADCASRAIVAQMKADEIAHAQVAMKAGAVELPTPIKSAMQMAAKVMTTVAHRV